MLIAVSCTYVEDAVKRLEPNNAMASRLLGALNCVSQRDQAVRT